MLVSLTNYFIQCVSRYLPMFDKCGFHCPTKLNILGTELLKDYFGPEGPLKKEWRKCISLYWHASEQEIMEIEQLPETCRIRELFTSS